MGFYLKRNFLISFIGAVLLAGRMELPVLASETAAHGTETEGSIAQTVTDETADERKAAAGRGPASEAGGVSEERSDTEEEASGEAEQIDLAMEDLYVYMLDSRWKNHQYDPRDRSARIGDYGCVLCCMTMIQSYMDNLFHRPDELCEKMSFDGDGCITWRGEIDGQYSRGDYDFAVMRELLEDDKPLIVRSKTGRKSHFVVVTGYENGGESADDFKILDPGNKNRRKLTQHMAKYPKAACIYYAE